MKSKILGSLAVALLGVVPLSVAHASLITWAYSGTVTSTTDAPFSNGQTVTGTLTFENSTSGTVNGPGTQAVYLGALRSFTIDGYPVYTLLSTASGIDTNEIQIRDGLFNLNALGTGQPGYIDLFSAILQDASPTQQQSFQFFLEQRAVTDPNCINSVALPTAPYSPLSCFDGALPANDALVAYNFTSTDSNVRFRFTLELDSLRAAAVPEPGSLALLGLGLAGLGLCRRRKA